VGEESFGTRLRQAFIELGNADPDA
jgi:hypothetical protein